MLSFMHLGCVGAAQYPWCSGQRGQNTVQPPLQHDSLQQLHAEPGNCGAAAMPCKLASCNLMPGQLVVTKVVQGGSRWQQRPR